MTQKAGNENISQVLFQMEKYIAALTNPAYIEQSLEMIKDQWQWYMPHLKENCERIGNKGFAAAERLASYYSAILNSKEGDRQFVITRGDNETLYLARHTKMSINHVYETFSATPLVMNEEDIDKIAKRTWYGSRGAIGNGSRKFEKHRDGLSMNLSVVDVERNLPRKIAEDITKTVYSGERYQNKHFADFKRADSQ
ncbi:MAG: hypothetical protein Q8O89_06770 [Nanoarchaeota archaeon]|nr:hypothetical protein [Nanoarchaeota archaeon]